MKTIEELVVYAQNQLENDNWMKGHCRMGCIMSLEDMDG